MDDFSDADHRLHSIRAALRESEFEERQNLNGAVEVHEQTPNEANDALPLPNEKTNEKVEDDDDNSTWSWDTATTDDDDNGPLQPEPEPLRPRSLPVRQLGLSRRTGRPNYVDDENYIDFDVITVHGVRDDTQTAWTTQADDSNWIETKLFEKFWEMGYEYAYGVGNVPPPIRQLDYVYDTGNSARIYDPSADGISAEANALLESLAQDRAKLPPTEAHRPIIWICHDLGGSIVKKALVNALHNEPDPGSQDGPVPSLHIRTIYRRLPMLTSSIIFLACPHGNESEDELEDQLLALMKLPGPPVTTQIWKKIANLSRQIERINLEFLETNVLDHAVIVKIARDLAEDTEMPSQIAQHSIADNQADSPTGGAQAAATPVFARRGSATHHNLGLRYNYYLTGTDHLALVRGPSASDFDWVSDLASLFNKKPGFNIRTHHEHFAYQNSLLSLSPPTREYKYENAVKSLSHPPAMSWIPVMWWILEQDSVVRQLAREHETKIVYLHAGWSASQAINMKMVSQRLYTSYDLRKPMCDWRPETGCFYFEFDDHDNRRASIKDMIVSFMSIFAGRFCDSDGYHYMRWSADYMRRFRSWSLRHLTNVFLDVEKASFMNNVTIILGGFDNCEEKERSAFIQALLDRQDRSEKWFNLVITTMKPDGLLCDRLPPANIINLEDCPLSIEDYLYVQTFPLARSSWAEVSLLVRFIALTPTRAYPGPHVTEDRIKHLLARRPELTDSGLVLSQIFGMFAAVPILQERVLEWLADYQCDSPAEFNDTLRKIACSPHQELWSDIVKQLSVPEQHVSTHIFDWIKYAAEPPTLEILVESVRYALPRETQLKHLSNHGDFSSFLERVMGGIILRDGRDLKFSDDAFYKVSASTGPDAERDQVHRSHASMATACLRYLLGTEGQKMLTSLSVERQGIVDLSWSLITLPRHSLVSYALRFWPVHYRAAGDYRPTELALELLQNGPKKAAWAEAFYVASNPFTRMERDYVSSLPYMAMFGLDDLVRSQIESEGGPNSRNPDHWLAIAEAALNGHGSTVALLLDHTDADAAGLGEALTCAARYGEGGALDILMSRAQQLKSFSWPRGILAHAVAAGLENLVLALVQAGYDLNDACYDYPLVEDGLFRDWSALHLAVESGQDRLLNILLDSGRVGLGLEDRNRKTALPLAAELGTAASIRLLLDAGDTLEAYLEAGFSMERLLYKTIQCGNHQALEVLIDAGVYSTDLLTKRIYEWDSDFHYTSKVLEWPASESSEWPAVIMAARRGFSQCTRILLDNGVDPNTHCDGSSPLYHATDSGPHIETCRILLNKGADPNKSTTTSQRTLLRAIQSGNKLLVEMLLGPGAQMNHAHMEAQDEWDKSLACAVQNDQYEIMELLLERGASANPVPPNVEVTSEDLESCPPLFVAAWERRDVRFIETLIHYGANVNWRESGKGWTVLHAAYDTPDTLSLLLKNGADVNATKGDGGTVLIIAVENKLKECVQLLLEQTDPKADLETATTDGWGSTALTRACETYDADILELLLDAGADINRPRADGLSPLMLLFSIASGIRDDDVTMMIKRGAKLDHLITSDEGTILHEIYGETPVSLVLRLVEEGAPVNTADKYGRTPLSLAVQRGNLSAARYLTTVKGVQSNVSHPSFGSILHAAAEGRTLDMVKQLVRTGAEPSVVHPEYNESASVLYSAIVNEDRRERRKIVRYLVEDLRVDVNAPGGKLGSPLLRAVADRSGSSERLRLYESAYGSGCIRNRNGTSLGNSLVKYLLQHGARPDQPDKLGRTPAHWAVLRDDFDALKTLGEFGADFSKADNFGRTPLHFAASRRADTSRLKMIAYISEKAPKDVDIINTADLDGWTPLMWACKTTHSFSDRLGLVLINDYKADARVRSRDGQWSALKLAASIVEKVAWKETISESDASEYLDALAKCVETQGVEKSLVERDREIESFSSQNAGTTCESCMTNCYGPGLICHQCFFRVCFKCRPHAELEEMHNQDHPLFDWCAAVDASDASDAEADLSVHESGSGAGNETEEEETEEEETESETEDDDDEEDEDNTD